MKKHFVEHKAIYIISLVFGLLVGYLGWQANYSINDDWTYGWSVKTFCETNQLKFLASSATCFTPIMLGSLVCKLFGFSFSVLHMLSVFFAVAAAVAIYLTLLELHIEKKYSLLAAAIFLANPFIVNLSICFMTDLPAITFNCWVMYYLVRALGTESKLDWFICTVFILLSVATRQTYLLILPAFIILAIWLIVKKRKDGLFFAACLVLPVIAYFILDRLLIENSVYALPFTGYKAIIAQEAEDFISSPFKVFKNLISIACKMNCYTGLFLLPISAVIFGNLFTNAKNKSMIWLSCSLGLLATLPLLMLIKHQQLMPYFCNYFNPPIIGTYSLIGVEPRNWSQHSLEILTYFCILAAFLITTSLIASIFSIFQSAKTIVTNKNVMPSSLEFRRGSFFAFNLIVLVLYFAFICLLLSVQGLDRYIIVLIVPLLITLFAPQKWLPYKFLLLGYALTFLSFVYAYVAAQDYIAYCSAKNNAALWLTTQGIDAKEIDAGPEYNYLVNPALIAKFQFKGKEQGWGREDRGKYPLCDKRWWAITNENYVISLAPIENYEQIQTLKYWSPLKFRYCDIYINKAKQ